MKSENNRSAKDIQTLFNRILNGPQTLGDSRLFWIGFLLTIVCLYLYPLFVTDYTVMNTTYFLVWPFLGLSLCVLWGYTGIFSFAQVVFFALSGYVYGVISINLLPITGNTNIAVIGSLLFAAAISAIIGYIMFYGGVSGLYVAIFTLMISILSRTFMAQTGGPEFQIGQARLGGYNGMINIPPLNFGIGRLNIEFFGVNKYYLVLTVLILIYLGLRILLNSNLGFIMVGVREAPKRTEMFGYDIRKIRLLVFILGGILAGLGGIFYVSWNNFINPDSMGMVALTLPVIWVAAGGRKSILAVLLTTVFLQWFSQMLALGGSEYAMIIFGILVLMVVLFFPEGLVPSGINMTKKLVNLLMD